MEGQSVWLDVFIVYIPLIDTLPTRLTYIFTRQRERQTAAIV